MGIITIKLIKANPIEFEQLISEETSNEKSVENKYAFIDIYGYEEKTVSFKQSNIDIQIIHFVYDKDGKIYIARLAPGSILELKKIKDNVGEIKENSNSFRIKGLTSKIPDSLKTNVIEAYNEIFEKKITENDFNKIFGSVYIDAKRYPDLQYYAFLFVILAVLIELMIILHFVDKYVYLKKSCKKLEDPKIKKLFYEDLEKSDVIKYENIKTILTSNYLFYYDDLTLTKYYEIKWIYKLITDVDKLTKGIVINKDNGEELIIQNILFDEKNGIEYDEVYNKIIEKNGKDLLVNFSKENKLKYEEMIKKKRR